MAKRRTWNLILSVYLCFRRNWCFLIRENRIRTGNIAIIVLRHLNLLLKTTNYIESQTLALWPSDMQRNGFGSRHAFLPAVGERFFLHMTVAPEATNKQRTHGIFLKGRGRNMQQTHGVCILNNRYCTIWISRTCLIGGHFENLHCRSAWGPRPHCSCVVGVVRSVVGRRRLFFWNLSYLLFKLNSHL